ncbi:V-type ATP synthase subunit I domain-containing protein [Aliarcobacter cryaerophilus]|uniref:hypothetical protein n=1 Tax=Aliarcobacter cryaerophilus TaxID=28198 RepID=UPI00112F300A|nr:hypothetical protein [Aliarcobacter cryaerophilus]
MRKGTFSVQTANPNSAKHNSRELAPKYLIDTSAKNYYELLKKDDDFILEAQAIYKEKIKQTMQKKQVENLIQETVLTLQPNQDENDVKDLFKKLNKKYGGHELLEVAIHRDEGYFLKDDIAYYPTKNILNKNGDWYVCSDTSIKRPKKDDFDQIVNIDEFEKVFNYHAHAKFSMFDRETGKSARMQKKDMSERIKFVSDELGLLFAPDQETSRIKKSVNLVKDEHLARAREMETQKELKQELAKAKDLQEINKQLREELKEMGALRADYAQLEALNKELKEQVKNKTLTIEELNNIINEYKQEKAPKRNENILNDKSIPEKEKEVLNQFTSDLTTSMQKEIKRELVTVKTGLLKSEDKELNIINEPNSLFQSIKKSFSNQFNVLYELAKEKAKEFYKDIIKSKDTEISELKEKNKELLNSNFSKDKKIERLEEHNKVLSTEILQQLSTKQQKENITTTPKAQTLEEILKSPNVKKEDLKKETPKRRLDIQK